MTHVPDFTSGPGAAIESLRLTRDYRFKLGGTWRSWQTDAKNVTTRQRFKSTTVVGNYIGETGFRKATPYRRCISQLESLVDDARWYTLYNGLEYEHKIEDSRAPRCCGLGASTRIDYAKGLVTVDQNLIDRAINEAYLKILDKKLDLGVMLGEMKQTVGYLGLQMIRLLKFYRRLRRGQLLSKSGEKLDPGNAWLEYQYAFMPLIYDVWGATELAREGLRKRNLLFRVTRCITEDIPIEDFATAQTPSYDGRATQSAKVTFWGRVTSNPLGVLGELGLINPALVAWELVPYSFVIDWLIPIGDWLEGLTATLGVQFVDGSIAKMVQASVRVKSNNPGFGTFLRGTKPVALARHKGFQRETYSSFPWVLPYIKSPLSTAHTATALALLKQLRK